MANFLNPKEIIKKLKLKANMTAADFGAGSGFWSIPLAEELGEGKVVAIDIQKEPLSALKSKVKHRNINNLEISRSNIEKMHGSKLLSKSCDLVLMTNLLFEIEDKKIVLSEASRVLKDNGRILVVDWKENDSFGPRENAISSSDIKNIKEIPFQVSREFEAGPNHWAMILEKKPSHNNIVETA
ncbi:MAG: class I SAM-dependent methyltransferase [Patescibacteria group bacterium]